MPTLNLSKECTFLATHSHPPNKEKVHEHTFRIRVTVQGALTDPGLVMNLDHLKDAIEKAVTTRLDQQYLNTLFDPPTIEYMVIWIWEQLSPVLPNLLEVCLWITPESMVAYQGI